MTKSILVTGGAGFIGSNFVPYFAKKYPDYTIFNLDKLTYAANLENLSECKGMPNYNFIKGDICDANLVNDIFKDCKIQGVIHFAAESHVDNSIKGPMTFINTNIVGTANLLEAARENWMDAPFKTKKGQEQNRFHHISTDEVYGALGESGLFTESTPYDPSSPYSASKASSDHLVSAWHRTFGLNATISNCSNNYGPKQHPEKLIPKIISNCVNEKPIPIYGRGENVRDWLYVLDHAYAIDLIFHSGISGQTYNIGGHNERTNMQIVNTICQIMDQRIPRKNGKYADLITFVADRPGHDLRYAIDATKIRKALGWKPAETFDKGIIKTVDWYLQRLR